MFMIFFLADINDVKESNTKQYLLKIVQFYILRCALCTCHNWVVILLKQVMMDWAIIGILLSFYVHVHVC